MKEYHMKKNRIRNRIDIVLDNIEFTEILFDLPKNDFLSKYIDKNNHVVKMISQTEASISELKSNCLLILVIENHDVTDKLIQQIASTRTFHQNNLIIIYKKFNSGTPDDFHESLMSFGFKLLFTEEQEKIFYDIYEYNIIDYKNKPEWLNSDYWANPELWEK